MGRLLAGSLFYGGKMNTNPIEVKVASYARFSSANQREASIEIQQEHINKFCKENGLTIVKEYVDRAQSATTDNRPEFQRMIAESSSGLFSFVVVYNTSRFCRNIQDHLKYRAILESNNVKILSVQDGFDQDTPEGDLMTNFMMSINQYYSKDLARKAYLGALESAKQCRHVGGTPPLGYGVTKEKKYYVIEEEADIVRTIFSMVEQNYTYQEIADYLNKKGLKNKNGKPFKPPFTDLLTNRKYIGEYVWNRVVSRTPLGTRSSRILKGEEEVIRIPNGMPSIITREQFDAVQRILEKRRTSNHRFKITEYLLSSLLVCNDCGFRMVGCKSNDTGNTGIVKRIAYKCESHSKRKLNCNTVSINVVNLDTYVLNLLNNVLVNERYAKRVQRAVQRSISANIHNLKQRIRLLQQQIDEDNKEIKRIADTLVSLKSILYQTAVSKIETITANKLDKEEEKARLIEISKQNPTVLAEIVRDNMLRYKKMSKDRTFGNTKTLLRLLIKEIRLDNKNVIVRLNLKAYINYCPFDNLSMDIIEDTCNIRDTANQYRQRLTWDELRIRTATGNRT